MVVVVVVVIVVLGVAGLGAGWFVWSWVIVVSDLLLGRGRLVRGRLESAVPGAWSGVVLRVRVPSSRIVKGHMRWTGPSAGFGLQLSFLEQEDF